MAISSVRRATFLYFICIQPSTNGQIPSAPQSRKKPRTMLPIRVSYLCMPGKLSYLSSFSLPYCSQVLHRSWTMHGLLWASGLPFPRSPALRSSLLLSAQFCEQINERTTLRPEPIGDHSGHTLFSAAFHPIPFKEEITSLIEKRLPILGGNCYVDPRGLQISEEQGSGKGQKRQLCSFTPVLTVITV